MRRTRLSQSPEGRWTIRYRLRRRARRTVAGPGRGTGPDAIHTPPGPGRAGTRASLRNRSRPVLPAERRSRRRSSTAGRSGAESASSPVGCRTRQAGRAPAGTVAATFSRRLEASPRARPRPTAPPAHPAAPARPPAHRTGRVPSRRTREPGRCRPAPTPAGPPLAARRPGRRSGRHARRWPPRCPSPRGSVSRPAPRRRGRPSGSVLRPAAGRSRSSVSSRPVRPSRRARHSRRGVRPFRRKGRPRGRPNHRYRDRRTARFPPARRAPPPRAGRSRPVPPPRRASGRQLHRGVSAPRRTVRPRCSRTRAARRSCSAFRDCRRASPRAGARGRRRGRSGPVRPAESARLLSRAGSGCRRGRCGGPRSLAVSRAYSRRRRRRRRSRTARRCACRWPSRRRCAGRPAFRPRRPSAVRSPTWPPCRAPSRCRDAVRRTRRVRRRAACRAVARDCSPDSRAPR